MKRNYIINGRKCAHKSSRNHGTDERGQFAQCGDCGEKLRAHPLESFAGSLNRNLKASLPPV